MLKSQYNIIPNQTCKDSENLAGFIKKKMKPLLLLIALALPFAIFAQGPNTNVNPPVQGIQTKNKLANDDEMQVETNVATQQAATPAKQGGSLGALFGANTETGEPCTDCDEVKKAIKSAHGSSGGMQHKKPFRMKKWSRTFSGKMHMKMKKSFASKHKVRSNYALCFNWH